jgi:Holliday junction resolvase
MTSYMRSGRLYRRGYRYELELSAKLYALGYSTLRAPASGKGGKPDVVAVRKGRVVAFEVKVRSKPRDIYIPKVEVERLKTWAERAGAEAYIAVRILDPPEWKLIPLDRLQETQGYYRISRGDLWNGYSLQILA